VLFSSSEVAGTINDAFEPAWESVRPAPLVTIDFGNGNVVKRTLQGNIATYVCNSDGTVYDVLPGIYAPEVYRTQLQALATLAASLRPKPGAPAPDLTARLRGYHTREAKRLQAAPPPSPQARAFANIGGGIKGGIGGLGALGGPGTVAGGGFGGGPPPPAGALGFGGGFGGLGGSGLGGVGGIEGPTERVIAGLQPVPLAKRPELQVDSEANERIRRKAVHDELAHRGPVRPDDLKKWLYKDVLHADLDDPLLGLGPVLNANYPFAEEERAPAGKR
jgi:hypothetical protein